MSLVKEHKISKELRDFRLKDFPPIESLKFDFVDLQTNEFPQPKEN